MTVPSATYRLQFREHLDFETAARLMPYLARLGVSHVYASPLQTARRGSTHGYDGIDFEAMDPALGVFEGFRAMAAAMQASGLRLLLDVVPNHMGVTPENPWWRDVLEWGADSAYARHFDIDWSAPRLSLPILGDTYARTLAKGDLKVGFDATGGTFTVAYYDTLLPLTPPSTAAILARMDDADLHALGRRLATGAPAEAAELKARLAASNRADAIRAALAEIEGDQEQFHTLLEAQRWRLQHWRNARERLGYRRFFEISDLVGVRVEDPRVFADVHRLVLRLVDEGLIDGLRIDHVDGLADPLGYLQRLQHSIGKADFYIVVEKILGPGERLRSEWPIAGSTGYEFIAALGGLLTDGAQAPALDAAYARFIGGEPAYEAMALAIKRHMLAHNFASEFAGLVRRAMAIAEADIATRDFGPDNLRSAIIELAASLRVYRTYIDSAGPQPEDIALLSEAAARAKATRAVEDASAIDFLVRVLTLSVPAPLQPEALQFAQRFQQATGPLMAKAIEDTLFYRYNRLIALNEVGGEPAHPPAGLDAFHEAMASRLQTQPIGLSTTATHDTKRGEDARARLYALSECPEAWGAAVQRWSQANARHKGRVSDLRVPEPETEWFFYQSLVGAWPPDLTVTDCEGIAALKERMQALMQKAVREAKSHTTWTNPDEDYERALRIFVDRVLDPDISRAFLDDFLGFAQPIFVAGALNSLTQLLVKLVAPGVPDIYQGTELWDLSLVDPDNRRAVDFALRNSLLETVQARAPTDLVGEWRSGLLKMRVLQAGLALRRSLQGWGDAPYVALHAEGPCARHMVGFARMFEERPVIAAGVRLPLTLLADEGAPLVPADRWQDTVIRLPAELAGRHFRDLLTGREVVLSDKGVRVAALLACFPVALLVAEP